MISVFSVVKVFFIRAKEKMPSLNLKPLPMREAIDFWKGKVKLAPGEFAKLTDEAKTRAFAVSGIAKGDELNTVFDALEISLSKGVSYEDFKKQAAKVFEARGWTGKRAWRVDNIFRTNIQTAYNVGRYKQMQEIAKTRPYWQYDAVNDSRTRPAHAAMDGKVFPADHPFWDRWYPPNGFRCRYSVDTLSPNDVKKEGLKVETKDPTGTLVEPTDPVTGNKLPARPLMPDKGFAYHPGKAAWGGLVENSFAKSAKAGSIWVTVPGLKTAADYNRTALADIDIGDIPKIDKSLLLPSGKSDEFYKKEFIKRYGEVKVVKDAAGEPVILSLRSFLEIKEPGIKKTWKFSKPGHGESIPLIGQMIEKPYEIWLTPQRNKRGKIRLTKRYISLFRIAGKKTGGFVIFESQKGVFQGVTSFIPFKKGEPDLDYLERQRIGLLLFRTGQ